MWLVYALLAALFACLTMILAKVMRSLDSNITVTSRPGVVLVVAWIVVLVAGCAGKSGRAHKPSLANENWKIAYCIHRVASAPPLTCDWHDPAWQGAETAELTHARPEGSDHRPKVAVRLLHDGRYIYGLFQVHDRYVRAVNIRYQAAVYKDSCVEFFFRPDVGPGYFNLEMNAGGSYLFQYGSRYYQRGKLKVNRSAVAEAYGRMLTVKTTLPEFVEPEIEGPLTWYVQFVIPVATLEAYCGKIDALGKRTWRGNFYKCADETSHPHWLAWAPLPRLSHHLPECFGTLTLE